MPMRSNLTLSQETWDSLKEHGKKTGLKRDRLVELALAEGLPIVKKKLEKLSQ